MESEPMLTPREKSPLPENLPRGGSNPQRCITQDSEPKHYQRAIPAPNLKINSNSSWCFENVAAIAANV